MHQCLCSRQQATAQTAQRDPSNAQKLHSGSLSREQCTHCMQHRSTAVLAPVHVNTPQTMQTHETWISFSLPLFSEQSFRCTNIRAGKCRPKRSYGTKQGMGQIQKHFQVSCQQTPTTNCIAASRPADCLALLMLQPMAEAPTMTAHSQPANQLASQPACCLS
jgi:hypothetical protein